MLQRAFLYTACIVTAFGVGGCLKSYADPDFRPGEAIVPIRLEAHAPRFPMAGSPLVRVHVYDVGEACTEAPQREGDYLGVISLDTGGTVREVRVIAGHRLFFSFRLDSQTRGGARKNCDVSGWLFPIKEGEYDVQYRLADGVRCSVEVYEATRRRTSGLSARCL